MPYRKGARAERELTEKLWACGFAVVRSAGSGNLKNVPDVIAIKNGKILAFECKFRKNELSISKEELENLSRWAERANANLYIAWKVPRKGWFFIKPRDLKFARKHYRMRVEEAEKVGLSLEIVLGLQKKLVE